MNILGHNPDNKVKRFTGQYWDHRVPVKLWGKHGHDERGEMIKSSYIFV